MNAESGDSPLFRQRTEFAKAFPDLEDAILEYRSSRPGGAFQSARPLPTTRISFRDRGRPIMHCMNPRCQGGDYDFSSTIPEMLAHGALEREGLVAYRGRNVEPGKPWDECARCTWQWDYRLALVPRTE